MKQNRISVSSYTESFYNFFASSGINRTWITRDQDGEFKLSYIKGWRLIFFVILRINVYLKIIFLVLLFNGYFTEELDFFTKFGISIWLVTTSVAVFSDYYYLFSYPCFEILCSFWNIQSEIYSLLPEERRAEFKKRLNSGAKVRSVFHMTMSSIAMIGLGIQYVMDPKGVLFTGSLVSNEPFFCTVLLGVLEEVFLYATWAQAVSVILVNVLAYRELTVVFDTLAKELVNLTEETFELKSKDFISLTDTLTTSSSSRSSRYTIDLIFLEFRKLQIISEEMRKIMSPMLLTTIIIYFAQISSDVFVGIRLLRMDAFMDVGFYAADCCCGMLYWFVSLNSLSKLDISVDDFHFNLKSYFRTRPYKRVYYLKKYKSFRDIAAYIGPSVITRLTVATCMMTLVNYYILAAMW